MIVDVIGTVLGGDAADTSPIVLVAPVEDKIVGFPGRLFAESAFISMK